MSKCLRPVEHEKKVANIEITYDKFADDLPIDVVTRVKPKSYVAGVSWDNNCNEWTHFTQILFTAEELQSCYLDRDKYSIKKANPNEADILINLYTQSS